jgi:hypothetical protein
LIQERVPQFWNVFVTEFTPLGLALIVIGGLWAIVRRSAAGMLFAAGAAGIVVLTMNVGADVEGFLVAACVPAWALAGLGLQAVRDAIRRLPRPAAALLGAVVVAALPIWQLSRNYAANDHHRRTYEDRYLRAMFAVLESRAAIVREAYSVDQLVLYKLAGERAAGERSIVMIPLDRAEVARHVKAGAVVYAFSTARSTLETRGITFEPVALRDPVGSGDAEIDMTPLPLYRVVSASECADIGNTGWRDVTDVARDGSLMIRIDNYRPFEATVSILAGVEPGAGAPELVIAQGPVRPTLSWTSASRPYDWPPAVQSAGLPNVARADLRVNDRGDSSIAWLRWPSPPSRVWARAVVDLDNPRRAVLCNWSRADFFHASRTASVPLAEQGDPFFGQGWQAPEAMNEGGHMRRTAGAYAEILVPLPEPRAIRVRLHARALGTVERHPISIRINGHRMAVKPMAHVWTTFEWDVPAGMWRDGLNRLTVESGDPAFDVGLALSQLTFELLD